MYTIAFKGGGMQRRFVVVALFGLLTLVGLGLTAAEAPTYVFRLAHISDVTHPSHKGALLFKQIVEDLTNGKVRIDIYPNSMLGSAPEYGEQIRMGLLEMGLLTSGQLQAWVKEYSVVMTPFLFSSYEHAHRVLDGPAGQFLAKLAERENFHVIADWEWGFRQITNNVRPINTPDDIAGLKMRVPLEFQLVEMYKALGAVTTTISFPELYMALAQGVADGQCNPLATIYAQKFYEVQKYLAITNHVYNSQMLVMSKSLWDTLPDDIKEILTTAGRVAGLYVRQLVQQSEQKIIEELKARGVIVTYPDLSLFREKVKPAMDAVAQAVGVEFANVFFKIVNEERTNIENEMARGEEWLRELQAAVSK
jgi:tripartite ATP-independent transporter DctP family solute receptor